MTLSKLVTAAAHAPDNSTGVAADEVTRICPPNTSPASPYSPYVSLPSLLYIQNHLLQPIPGKNLQIIRIDKTVVIKISPAAPIRAVAPGVLPLRSKDGEVGQISIVFL